MYTNTRFRSTETTSDFGTKFVHNYMNGKTFEKINIKIVISIHQCTPLRSFSHFVELQIMGPKFEKINIKIVISI